MDITKNSRTFASSNKGKVVPCETLKPTYKVMDTIELNDSQPLEVGDILKVKFYDLDKGIFVDAEDSRIASVTEKIATSDNWLKYKRLGSLSKFGERQVTRLRPAPEKLYLSVFEDMPVTAKSLEEIKRKPLPLCIDGLFKVGSLIKILEAEIANETMRFTMKDIINLANKMVQFQTVSKVLKEASGKDIANEIAINIAQTLNEKILARGVFWKNTKNDCVNELNRLIKTGKVILKNDMYFFASNFDTVPQFEKDEDLLS